MYFWESNLYSRFLIFAFWCKGPSSQGYGFSSSHVWMWELDCEESWALKNWCFWTVVLEKTLKSPLYCKKIQPVHPKGDQPWVFFGRTDAKAETPVLWLPHAKSWLIGKDSDAGRDWGQEEKRTTEDGWDGWMASLTQWTWVWVDSRIGDGQGSLACCNSWGRKESDMTERLNWTELNSLVVLPTFFNLSLNLAISSSWSEPQSVPGPVFADYIQLIHLWLQRKQSIWFWYWPSGDVHV